jgi:hypothetical protein
MYTYILSSHHGWHDCTNLMGIAWMIDVFFIFACVYEFVLYIARAHFIIGLWVVG